MTVSLSEPTVTVSSDGSTVTQEFPDHGGAVTTGRFLNTSLLSVCTQFVRDDVPSLCLSNTTKSALRLRGPRPPCTPCKLTSRSTLTNSSTTCKVRISSLSIIRHHLPPVLVCLCVLTTDSLLGRESTPVLTFQGSYNDAKESLFGFHANSDKPEAVDVFFRDSGARREECVGFLNKVWDKAETSLRIALYCLNSQQLLNTLYFKAQNFKHGKIVVILDANDINVQAVKKLAPIFHKTGNELRVWVREVCLSTSTQSKLVGHERRFLN